MCCQSICSPVRFSRYAAVAVIPAGRIAGVVARLLDSRDRVIQKFEEIPLVNGPFEDHSANNFPLQLFVLISPREIQQDRAVRNRRDQIVQIGLAFGLVVVSIGLVVVVGGNHDRGIIVRIWIHRPERVIPRARRGSTQSDGREGVTCSRLLLIHHARQERHPRVPHRQDLIAIGLRPANFVTQLGVPCSRWWSPARRRRNIARCGRECPPRRGRRRSSRRYESTHGAWARSGPATLHRRTSGLSES